MYARVRFLELTTELYDNAFEEFFHSIMCARYPDYFNIRTAGKLGDQGADGLLIHACILYACYAPQTFSAAAVTKKFRNDLAIAVAKRREQFETFAFVHNDRRGVHPKLSSLLREAAKQNKDLRFMQMGLRALWREIMQLSLEEVEDLLHCPIPIVPTTYGIGMEELAPLLTHIKEARKFAPDPLREINEVSELKLDFNAFDDDTQRQLRSAMKYTPLVERYYGQTSDDAESEEVAAGFANYYQIVRTEWDDPEEILWQMEMYVLGNASHPPQVQRAAWVILAYFFERCFIFEEPPPGWTMEETG
jgi:hypothetical protein